MSFSVLLRALRGLRKETASKNCKNGLIYNIECYEGVGEAVWVCLG
jgi:hypothetical protein